MTLALSSMYPLTTVLVESTPDTPQELYLAIHAVFINVLPSTPSYPHREYLLMYSQNRLFWIIQETNEYGVKYYLVKGNEKLDDYVVIPQYDKLLEKPVEEQIFVNIIV